MEINFSTKERVFIENYFRHYGERNPIIKNFIDTHFIGLDGITNIIYDNAKWLKAIDDDFQQVESKFNIRIIDFDSLVLENNLIMAVCISTWDIELFQKFPEFDKVRTVFILKPEEESFKITHLSNSISLLALTQKELFPFTLQKVLKNWKAT